MALKLNKQLLFKKEIQIIIKRQEESEYVKDENFKMFKDITYESRKRYDEYSLLGKV